MDKKNKKKVDIELSKQTSDSSAPMIFESNMMAAMNV